MRYSNCLVCCFSFNVCCAFLLVGIGEKRNHVGLFFIGVLDEMRTFRSKKNQKQNNNRKNRRKRNHSTNGQREINVIEQFGKETEMN